MNKIFLILITGFLLTSCNSNQTNNKQDEDKNKVDDPFYTRKSIVYEYPNDIKEEYIIYVKENKDTFFTQRKIFKQDVLDTVNSNFYELELTNKEDQNYSGKITLYSSSDNLKNPSKRKLTLSFFNLNETFKSENQNFIDFKFQSDNDTLIGVLTDTRTFDTIINGKEMARIIQDEYPIDNKVKTFNPVVERMLEKNER